jgi:hypothetical protein
MSVCMYVYVCMCVCVCVCVCMYVCWYWWWWWCVCVGGGGRTDMFIIAYGALLTMTPDLSTPDKFKAVLLLLVRAVVYKLATTAC